MAETLTQVQQTIRQTYRRGPAQYPPAPTPGVSGAQAAITGPHMKFESTNQQKPEEKKD